MKHLSFYAVKKHIGLWIDHQRAVIVFVGGAGHETKVILSDADRQPGRIHGVRSTEPHEALLTMADDVKDRRFASHLNHYYDEVIDCVHEAESLLVFGPGEAKGEFTKRLSHVKPTMRSLHVEPADKMTYGQVAARVREYFKKDLPLIAMK